METTIYVITQEVHARNSEIQYWDARTGLIL